METHTMECGCSFSYSIFIEGKELKKGEILKISPCRKHGIDDQVQQKLKDLEVAIRDLFKTDSIC